MTGSPIITVSRCYLAAAERIFDAWLDAGSVGQWLFATPSGRVIKAEIDARIGGGFCIVDRRPQGDAAHYGEYLEIERPRRLVFRFSVEAVAGDGDLVTIDIEPRELGCELTLSHVLKPQWAEYAGRTREGWGTILDQLAGLTG